ncbi:MAG: N-acetylneuraminate synthase [Prochlorococcus marinus CUG1438]|nr:N-acetylneuraminate synthase [Prochlorococcus marinus CUG1438]
MSKTLIIAEAGVNHNGDIKLAHKLIDAAYNAGADIVKFQTFLPSELSTDYAPLAEYQKSNIGNQVSQLDMLNNLKLSESDHHELIEHCNEKNIEFLSTSFDLASLSLLKKFSLKRNKIPSGEITNLPLIRKIAAIKKPIILSTGMSTLGEIEIALEEINKYGTNKDLITILHCSTEYPASIETVNLKAMNTIKSAFGVKVGYSDHTEGIDIAVAAVALGAVIIEKHLTIDRTLPGPDHKASIEPNKFAEMVKNIRRVEIALGSNIKKPSNQELENRKVARKSIVAKQNINIGDVFNSENLCVKRPGTGISPLLWDELIGKTSRHNFKKDNLIKW